MISDIGHIGINRDIGIGRQLPTDIRCV